MASSEDFVRHVSEQCSKVGNIAYRKMFGEYGLYCDGKIFALVCDNQFFVKITSFGKCFKAELKTAPPYDGAKSYFVMDDLDERDFFGLIEELYLL